MSAYLTLMLKQCGQLEQSFHYKVKMDFQKKLTKQKNK